jgi:hypothetical protein
MSLVKAQIQFVESLTLNPLKCPLQRPVSRYCKPGVIQVADKWRAIPTRLGRFINNLTFKVAGISGDDRRSLAGYQEAALTEMSKKNCLAFCILKV